MTKYHTTPIKEIVLVASSLDIQYYDQGPMYWCLKLNQMAVDKRVMNRTWAHLYHNKYFKRLITNFGYYQRCIPSYNRLNSNDAAGQIFTVNLLFQSHNNYAKNRVITAFDDSIGRELPP